MDRNVITNMGANPGAASTVFPSDHHIRMFLEQEGRGGDWIEIEIEGKGNVPARHHMSAHQFEILLAGGLINWVRARRGNKTGGKAAA